MEELNDLYSLAPNNSFHVLPIIAFIGDIGPLLRDCVRRRRGLRRHSRQCGALSSLWYHAEHQDRRIIDKAATAIPGEGSHDCRQKMEKCNLKTGA